MKKHFLERKNVRARQGKYYAVANMLVNYVGTYLYAILLGCPRQNHNLRFCGSNLWSQICSTICVFIQIVSTQEFVFHFGAFSFYSLAPRRDLMKIATILTTK